MARRGENIRKRKDGRWEGRYIKARTPEGKIQWGYVYGTAYAEVKRVLIQRKAEAGFYNLNQTDLSFEVLAEVWLYSLKNAIKESTYAHYSYTLHKYLLPILSKVPVASLEESFLEQAIPYGTILHQLLGQRRRLWHHTFLAALAMLDQNIVRFDVFRLHQDHLIAAHPSVEQ